MNNLIKNLTWKPLNINIYDLFNWHAGVANYTSNYIKFGKEQANSVGFIGSGFLLICHCFLQKLFFLFKLAILCWLTNVFLHFSFYISPAKYFTDNGSVIEEKLELEKNLFGILLSACNGVQGIQIFTNVEVIISCI